MNWLLAIPPVAGVLISLGILAVKLPSNRRSQRAANRHAASAPPADQEARAELAAYMDKAMVKARQQFAANPDVTMIEPLLRALIDRVIQSDETSRRVQVELADMQFEVMQAKGLALEGRESGVALVQTISREIGDLRRSLKVATNDIALLTSTISAVSDLGDETESLGYRMNIVFSSLSTRMDRLEHLVEHALEAAEE